MDRLVQQPGETVVDTCPCDHQPDLDDPLPDHPRQLRIRVRARVFQGKVGWKVALPFAINLVANLLFMPIFSGLRNVPLAAAVLVGGLAVLPVG